MVVVVSDKRRREVWRSLGFNSQLREKECDLKIKSGANVCRCVWSVLRNEVLPIIK